MPAELNGGGEVAPAGSAALSSRAQEVEQVRLSTALWIVVPWLHLAISGSVSWSPWSRFCFLNFGSDGLTHVSISF
jgi:hypothetical protein